MRKIVAAGLAAALSLSIAPAASAQLSSLGSLSSSSGAVAPKPQEEHKKSQEERNAEDLGNAFETAVETLGATRYEGRDRIAESALEDALTNGVAWFNNPQEGPEGFYAAEELGDDYYHYFIRVAHSATEEIVGELQTNLGDPFPEDSGIEYPYGLTTDYDNDWVYIAITFPVL